MYCSKCGTQMDDNSDYCPHCGQRAKVSSAIGRSFPGTVKEESKKNKKLWKAAIVLVVIAVSFCGINLVEKLNNKMKSAPEKLLDMSWNEIADISVKDYSDLLDDKGVVYLEDEMKGVSDFLGTTDAAYRIAATTLEPFMGGDCFFEYTDVHTSMYNVYYETSEDFRNGRKSLEEYLNKRLIKNAAVLTVDVPLTNSKYFLYPVEKSDKKIDTYVDDMIRFGIQPGCGPYYSYLGIYPGVQEDDSFIPDPFDKFLQEIDFEEGRDALLEKLTGCSVYKFVEISFDREAVDYDMLTSVPMDSIRNSYAPGMIGIRVMYLPLTDEQFVALSAEGGYDAILNKEIDTNEFKLSVDEKLVNEYIDPKLDEVFSSNRKNREKYFYNKLYMMDRHNFDMESSSYLSEEEKHNWYIEQFAYDVEMGEFVVVTETYIMVQEENDLKMKDTMSLEARNDRVEKITETIVVDISSFDIDMQAEMKNTYDGLVEQYAAVDGVECSVTAGIDTYSIIITIDTTGSAVEELALQGLLAIDGDGSRLSLEATGQALTASGYELVN